MSWRKKIGWRGPLSDPVSLMTGAVSESAERLRLLGLRARATRTRARRRAPPAPTPPSTRANVRIIDPTLRESARSPSVHRTRSAEGAPKYSPRHPSTQPDPRCRFRLLHSASTSSDRLARRARGLRRPVRRGPLAQPLRLAAREAEEASTARRSSSSSQHHLDRPGALRLGRSPGPCRPAAGAAWPEPDLSSVSLRVNVAESPFAHHVEPAELPVPDAVLPGPAPARPHVAHRLARRQRAPRSPSRSALNRAAAAAGQILERRGGDRARCLVG